MRISSFDTAETLLATVGTLGILWVLGILEPLRALELLGVPRKIGNGTLEVIAIADNPPSLQAISP